MIALVACCTAFVACGTSHGNSTVAKRVTLSYAIRPYGGPVTAGKVAHAEQIIRRRLAVLGVPASVHARSGAMLVTVPRSAGKNLRTDGAVDRPGRLSFYDWEPNVIGRNGRPAPTEGTVTGDFTSAGAGGVTAGLPQYQAVVRAIKRLPVLRKTDTTWSPGCTPRQVNDCLYGSWYLLDTAHEEVLSGPEETQASLHPRLKPLTGAKLRAVRVNPGTVVVQAHATENESGKVLDSSPNSYYVLDDDPVLTGADLTDPQQSFEEGGGPPFKGQPNVIFAFTAHGKAAFEKLTKEVAHRGQERQLPGTIKEQVLQHFAVALDGQLITVPSVDFTRYPEGIDASTGSEIAGGFTIQSARDLAAELSAGPLPVSLALTHAPPAR